ncbi:G-protein coupled receptor Mth2-like [Aricia agestis]|uniref:G-protein coupled receptor Mth2-like n=1 Tax=Aricia agestis TaxID=91739 RepID=UPI001C20769B|nr:G-protein coupled receptor Mth2-like [Aricia agestis]
MLKLIVLSVLVLKVLSNPCAEDQSVDVSSGERYSNGSIVHAGVEYTSGTWYQSENGTLGCPCLVRICLWKCCGENQSYVNRSCQDTSSDEPFNPPVYNGTELTEISAIHHFYYMHNIKCDKYLVDSNSSAEDMYLQENGTLYEISYTFHRWYPASRFCMETMTDSRSQRLVAGVCYPDEEEEQDELLFIGHAVGLLISVPFLIATFAVYAFVPDLRNLHGLCLMAYTGGLIVAYIMLAYLKLHTTTLGVGMHGCYASALIIYLSFQTSFFWLNVMCFDIWRTFSGYRASSNRKKDIRHFLYYGIYAWGVPLILTTITAVMQFHEDIPDYIITPGFGHRRCWFIDWVSEMLYFFGPVFLLVVCNVVLFAVTACRIRSIRQETAILKGSESSRSDKLKKDKQRYSLYLKLFLVMGVNWTAEVVGFAVGGNNWYWIVPDIANIVLGVYIFFVFVWKKKIRNLVVKRWRSIRGVQAAESSAAKWATRSSAATEDTRISGDDSAIRLKEMH